MPGTNQIARDPTSGKAQLDSNKTKQLREYDCCCDECVDECTAAKGVCCPPSCCDCTDCPTCCQETANACCDLECTSLCGGDPTCYDCCYDCCRTCDGTQISDCAILCEECRNADCSTCCQNTADCCTSPLDIPTCTACWNNCMDNCCDNCCVGECSDNECLPCQTDCKAICDAQCCVISGCTIPGCTGPPVTLNCIWEETSGAWFPHFDDSGQGCGCNCCWDNTFGSNSKTYNITLVYNPAISSPEQCLWWWEGCSSESYTCCPGCADVSLLLRYNSTTNEVFGVNMFAHSAFNNCVENMGAGVPCLCGPQLCGTIGGCGYGGWCHIGGYTGNIIPIGFNASQIDICAPAFTFTLSGPGFSDTFTVF